MRITNINSTNFQSKTKYVTQEQLKQIQKLTEMMHKDTVYLENGDTYTAQIVKSIRTKDISMSMKPLTALVTGKHLSNGTTEVQMNRRKKVVIDNATGQIVKLNKPFFLRTTRIVEDLSKGLNVLTNNYNDESIVKKTVQTAQGFTNSSHNHLMGITSDFFLSSSNGGEND